MLIYFFKIYSKVKNKFITLIILTNNEIIKLHFDKLFLT